MLISTLPFLYSSPYMEHHFVLPYSDISQFEKIFVIFIAILSFLVQMRNIIMMRWTFWIFYEKNFSFK